MKKRYKVFNCAVAITLALAQGVTVASATQVENNFYQKHAVKDTSEELVRFIIEVADGADKQAVIDQVVQYKNTTLKQNFSTALHGFSVESPSKNYLALGQVPGVKKVTKARTYQPAMASSKEVTQVVQARNASKNHGEGMVISIIDTGIDVDHKDFASLSDPSKAKIQTVLSNVGTDFNIKVPYGYNFADGNYDVIDRTDSQHGVHVAGISGANGQEDGDHLGQAVQGVADQAQLLAMKVFSNDASRKGASDDDIIAAIEKSIELKADVINLSLGSSAGFTNPDNPLQAAVNKAKEAGIFVVAAAGNEGTAVTKQGATTTPNNQIGVAMQDIGLVSTPSTAAGAISVASVENAQVIKAQAKVATASGDYTLGYKTELGTADNTAHQLVYKDLGRAEDYAENEDLTGKIALIKRGKITFVDKVNNALAHNAAGVILFNNVDGDINIGLSGAGETFVTLFNRADGEKLLEQVTADPNTTVTFTTTNMLVANGTAGQMSAFTSWGTTNTLDFKPEIAAIGGKVYSTVGGNKYQYMNGTSMASPEVAGIGALVLSQVKKDLPGLSDYADFTKKTLISTATPITNASTKTYYSPRRQGAGLVQTANAMNNRVLVSFNSADGESVGELRDFTGQKAFKVVLTNYGDKDLSFKLAPSPVQTVDTSGENVLETTSSATLTLGQTSVTVPAGQSVSLDANLDASSVTNQFVEGFIGFESQDASQPNLSFAYLGFAGQWDQEAYFDAIDSKQNTTGVVYGDTRLLTNVDGNFIPLGLHASEGAEAKMDETLAAFSPNGDGSGDVIIPQVGLLRNLEHLSFNVLEKDGNVVRELDKQEEQSRLYYEQYETAVSNGNAFPVTPFESGAWSGVLYNPSTGADETAPDGQYYLQVKGQLREGDQEKDLRFPVKVDTQAPKITLKGAYENTAEGIKVTFDVSEKDLFYNYAQVGDKEVQASQNADGSYSVLLPTSTTKDETVVLKVKDMAYNGSELTLSDVNSKRFESLDVTSEVNVQDGAVSLSGKVLNADTTKVKASFTNLADKTASPVEVVLSVTDKAFSGQSKLPQEGKYALSLTELDAKDQVLANTAVGDVLYDYTAPVFDSVVATHDTTTGKYQITGRVHDNLVANTSLKLSFRGQGAGRPKADGTFTVKSSRALSDGEVLEVSQTTSTGTVLKASYPITVTEVASQPKASTPSLEVTVPNGDAYGQNALKTDSNPDGTVILRDGKYYINYEITPYGSMSPDKLDIYVGDMVNPTAYQVKESGGMYYYQVSKLVELKEGTNKIGVLIKKDGKIVYESSSKVYFDLQLPTLTWSKDVRFETDKDSNTTYVLVEKGQDLTLSGTVADVGYGYKLLIDQDLVAYRLETNAFSTYSKDFTKTIKAPKDGDIVAIQMLDAMHVLNDKFVVKLVEPEKDLTFKTANIKEGQQVQVAEVVAELPEGYKLDLPDTTGLAVGSHELEVKVTYPSGKTKTEKVTVQVAEVQKDISFKENLTVKLGDSLSLDQVVADKANAEKVELVEDLSSLAVGTHTLHVRATYPSGVVKVFETSVTVAPLEVVTLAGGVVGSSVKADEKVLPAGTRLLLSKQGTSVAALGDKDLDVYSITLIRDNQVVQPNGDLLITLPVNKENFEGVYYVKEDGSVEKQDASLSEDQNSVSFTVSHLSIYAVAYKKVEKQEPTTPPTSEVVINENAGSNTAESGAGSGDSGTTASNQAGQAGQTGSNQAGSDQTGSDQNGQAGQASSVAGRSEGQGQEGQSSQGQVGQASPGQGQTEGQNPGQVDPEGDKQAAGQKLESSHKSAAGQAGEDQAAKNLPNTGSQVANLVLLGAASLVAAFISLVYRKRNKE